MNFLLCFLPKLYSFTILHLDLVSVLNFLFSLFSRRRWVCKWCHGFEGDFGSGCYFLFDAASFNNDFPGMFLCPLFYRLRQIFVGQEGRWAQGVVAVSAVTLLQPAPQKKLFRETPQAFLCVCFPEGKVCGVVRIYNSTAQRDCTLSF